MRWTMALSLAVGCLAAFSVAVILYVTRVPLSFTFEDQMACLICAAIVGLALGLLVLLVTTKHESAVTRLTHLIESAATDSPASSWVASPSASPPLVGMGLNDLASAFHHVLNHQHQQFDRLTRQRRELEVQLRLSQSQLQHLQTVLNSISDAVLVTDAFNELTLANHAAQRLLHLDLDSTHHPSVDQVISDPVLTKLIKTTRETAHAHDRRHLEHRLSLQDRSAVFDVTLACLPESSSTTSSSSSSRSQVAGVVTILRDITREKEIADMKSDFVSGVSHELRTPLSSIKAYLEMLIDGEVHDEQTRNDFYNIIQSETTRLSRLIDNILNLSRLESGVIKVQREHIHLPKLIKDALDVIAPQAHAKQMTLRELPPSFASSPTVFADKDMIHQVLLNLLSNAIKYTPNQGTVTVSQHLDPHTRLLHTTIADTGVGIPPHAIPHLFHKFYRVMEHKKLAKGTGLGLNLVKQIIETVHGGKVSVQSIPGQGSQFTFALPIADIS